ncbi:MAG: T9SS type A sorting domain-containing protein, partial [Elusimicrobia bacterium]|nr:T9SS type A sorting domain-containing protein [Elusimicrobiota bacterium]
GLPSAATFYARVRSLTGNGVPSVFDLVVSTRTGVDATAPAISTGLAAFPAGAPNAVTLSWIAAGDDGTSGDLAVGSKFFVQWSAAPQALTAWSPGSAQLVVSTGPVAAGARVSATLTGLPQESTVTLRVWTRDEAGNTSVQSDTTTVFVSPFAFTRLDGASGDAGLSPSLAADRFGGLHLVYRGAAGDLRYLKRSGGTWAAVQFPDPGVVAGDAAIAVDNDGNPQIAYRDAGVNRLKVARFNGAWTTSIVEAGDFRVGGLTLDGEGRAHLSYYEVGAGDLRYARWTGVAWDTAAVAAAGTVGRVSGIALTAAQVPVIVYSDDTSQTIGAATRTASGFDLLAVDGTAIRAASTTLVAIDGRDQVLAVYPDPAVPALRVSSGSLKGAGFVGSVPQLGQAGAAGGLALDGAGRPFVSFYDPSAKGLRYARAAASGTIDLDGDVGRESSLAIDGSGNVYAAYYDSTRGDLKFAEWTAGVTARARPPSGLAGTAVSASQIQWTFTDNSAGELGFALYGSQFSTGPFSLVVGSGSLPASAGAGGTLSYIESGLATNATYYRYVVAISSGGAPASKLASAFPFNTVDVTSPTITNLQAGDGAWRRAGGTLYNVDFSDIGGSHLTKFQVKAATAQLGGDITAFTDVVTAIGADAYTADWALPAAVFNALWEGTTNYISIRAFDGNGDATTLDNAFYVLKDTTAPSFTNSVAGDAAFRKVAGTLYDLNVFDMASRVAAFEYSVSTRPSSGDASAVGWTSIAALGPGVTSYATDWPVSFNALPSDVTSYVSVRAWDVAGATTTAIDAFYVRKDTAGPTVRITAPGNGTVLSTLTLITGTANDWAGVAAVGVSIQINPPAGNYWNGATFGSVTQQFHAASGTVNWQLFIPNPWTDATTYQVVARASDTLANFSGQYSTNTFTFDSSPPVAVATGPTGAVTSITTLAGTAVDATAGLSAIEVQLRRNTDGFWWNWINESWTNIAVSSVATGTTNWTITATPRLKSFLSSQTSYFVAARGVDQAAPPNSGNFFAAGATFTFTDNASPSAITDLKGSSTTAHGRVQLAWTSPGDDGISGDILFGQYAVGYSTDSAITFSTSAAQLFVATANVTAGGRRGLEVSNLVAGSTYFLHVWIADDAGNWSPLGNAATMQAGPPLANQIGGHVVKTSSEGITAVQLTCYDSNGGVISSTFTLGDGLGSFTLGAVPAGTFRVEASWSADGITSSVWQDNIQQGTSNVEFVLNLNYTLSSLTGTLGALTVASSGRGANAAPAFRPRDGSANYDDAKVELFTNGRRAVEVGVNPLGRWTIPNLLPGKYGVRAFNGVTYTELVDVELGEGELKEVGFVYNPLPEASVFAFPNPAKAQTTFRFETPLSPLEAQVLVFDLAGSLVREISGSEMTTTAPGLYHAPWDLRNGQGEPVASGVYVFMVKVKGGSDQQTAKIVKKLAVVK